MPIKQIKENTRSSRNSNWVSVNTIDISSIIHGSCFSEELNREKIVSESGTHVNSSRIEYYARVISRRNQQGASNTLNIVYGYLVNDSGTIKIITNISHVKNSGEIKYIKTGSNYYTLTVPSKIPSDYWSDLDINLRCWISSNSSSIKISSHTNSSKKLDNMVDMSMDIF